MIPYEDALQRMLDALPRLEPETAPLDHLQGRCLAEPLRAPFDIPGFDSTAVDGYAVKLSDARNASAESPIRLRVAADVHAGDAPLSKLETGTAQRVMTGAPIPEGSEAVIMREFTRESRDFVDLLSPIHEGANIRRRGEEFHNGAIVLEEGMVLNPAGVALVASLGQREAVVVRQPRVAILTTGNEVKAPGTVLQPGELYNSNRWGLQAALAEDNLSPVLIEHVSDTLSATTESLRRAAHQADLVITTGGVSMGDSDFVKTALREIGAEILFELVAIKPGKPMCFARFRQTFFVCCPGNPVSVLLSYHYFVMPALLKLMGSRTAQPLILTATLENDLRKKSGRRENVRAALRVEQGKLIASVTRGQDSHMLSGLASANCLIHFPIDATELKSGAQVEVEPISFYF